MIQQISRAVYRRQSGLDVGFLARDFAVATRLAVRVWCTVVTLFTLIGLGAHQLQTADATTDESAHSPDNFLHRAIEQCQPKMVKIYGAAAGRVEGSATGIIISDDGKILTTQGVFLDGQQVRVVTSDGESYQASVLRRNRQTQLALLQIQAPTPKYFELSKEDVGGKGDWVVVLANAFKVADKEEPLSVTLGVISLRTSIEARLNRRDVAYRGDLVLIDAITSNPGAGGGAVVTTDGELVGMVGKIINSSETNTRLNYAVPTSMLYEFATGKQKQETEVAKTKVPVELGIRLFKLGGRGGPAYIDRVVRSSPASDAELQSDDLIISLAGEKIGNAREYQQVLDRLEPDQEVLIVVKRGRELLRLPITPRERK